MTTFKAPNANDLNEKKTNKYWSCEPIAGLHWLAVMVTVQIQIKKIYRFDFRLKQTQWKNKDGINDRLTKINDVSFFSILF